MKLNKTILLSLIITLFIFMASSGILAGDNTTSPQGTISSELKIKELKEKLASRVAELNVVSQKVFKGEIKTISDQKIIFSVGINEVTASLNDDTSIMEIGSNFKKTKIQLDDLKVGQTIYIWGTFNGTTNTITAKSAVVTKLPLALIGKIKNVDRKNFQITITSSQKDFLVDIDQTTRTSIYKDKSGVAKSGFSKLAEGQQVFVYGFLTTNKEGVELLSAERIIILSEGISSTPSPTPTPNKTK